MPNLPRFRFSLRAFLLTLFVLSLFGSNAYVSWRWHESRQEIDRLREEMGYLTIDDPTMFYVREVPTHEDLKWRWRIYVPPGNRALHLGVGRVAATGLSAGSSSGFAPLNPRNPLVGEYTLTAQIERDQLGNWRLAASYPDGGMSQDIMKPDAGWLSEGNRRHHVRVRRKWTCRVEVAGSKPVGGSATKRQTESFSPDEPLVLLRLRAPENLKTDAGQPCDGVLIWFDKPVESRQ